LGGGLVLWIGMRKPKRHNTSKQPCDWCEENRRCIEHLRRALDAAPGWLESPIELVIDALERENKGCR